MARSQVTIVHKETGLTAQVLPSTVPTWEAHGWTVEDNKSSETVSQAVADDQGDLGIATDDDEEK